MKEEISRILGKDVTVIRSDENNQMMEGFVMFRIKFPDRALRRVGQKVEELDRNGAEIGGVHREVKLLRGIKDQPIAGIGSRCVIFVEEAPSMTVEDVYGTGL